MQHARVNLNAVILPDASILVFGGQNAQAPRQVERFWGGEWQELASASSTRDYHSAAVLLPDGRVLVAGGDYRENAANPATGPCDYEIYVPPYLASDAGVPSFTPSPPVFNPMLYNTWSPSWGVSTAPGVTIAKVVLMRPGSTTHHSDFDQRYVELEFDVSESTLSFLAPIGPPSPALSGTNAAPPGWYMLFLVTNQGVPSTAGWVNLVAL
jgi:hypothetical protein